MVRNSLDLQCLGLAFYLFHNVTTATGVQCGIELAPAFKRIAEFIVALAR